MKSCLVIGGDGYIGWSLVVELVFCKKFNKITVLDNLLTRRNVKRVGGNSITNILTFKDRYSKLKEVAEGKVDIEFIEGSTMDPDTVNNLISQSFHSIYHLGHQRTAPYSMLDQETCIETVVNNEVGFLNIIWALKKFSPETLLIKLGSFGAYAPSGIEVPESDSHIMINGKKTLKKVPFPKFATDFYHITKANDGLFARAACANWGLKIIDVMQSTVFGLNTKFTDQTNLPTRFDYDEIFGTVLNRFICQSIAGHKLTVYGGGEHSTGIMVLRDAVSLLLCLSDYSCEPGEYKIINSNPYSYKIIELAQIVKKQAELISIPTHIDTISFDPRNEKNNEKHHVTTAECKVLDKNVKISNLETEIAHMLPNILKLKEKIDINIISPKHKW
jgi:UDP-sulfoquinovose synthase